MGAGKGLRGPPDPRGPSEPTVRQGASGLGATMTGRLLKWTAFWGQEADPPGPARVFQAPFWEESYL